MTYAKWHMLISLANDLHQLLKSEADQSDAAEALASEIIASFKKTGLKCTSRGYDSHWPNCRRFRTNLALCHLFPECMKEPGQLKLGLTKLVPKMTHSENKSQGRRTIADSFMRDAQRDATPWRSRADLAFEALYLYALSALGEQADNYAHPDARVLTAAAEELGLTADQIGPALEYLEHRYDPAIPDNGSAYRVLISIATLLGAER